LGSVLKINHFDVPLPERSACGLCRSADRAAGLSAIKVLSDPKARW